MTKPTRYYSEKQETYVAKELGGEVVKNSGGNMFKKGDVIVTHPLYKILIECKTKKTQAKSFSIKKDWLVENEQDKMTGGYDLSALIFNFAGEEQDNYVVLSLKDFRNILEDISERVEEE